MSYNPPPPNEEPLVGEVRVRVPLPFFIPLVSLAIIAALAIGFSRVLLAVPAEAATVIAMAVAANILIACAFIALKPRVGGATFMELLAIIAYPILIGVVIANVGIGASEGDAAHGSEAPAENGHGAGGGDGSSGGGGGGDNGSSGGGGGSTTVVAENVAFDTNSFEFPAGEDVTIEFDNQDTLEHNIAIYEDQATALTFEDAIFQGETIDGGESTTYEFTAPDAGEYYFHCDVHPNMSGTVITQ